jgi:hypothetical protein
MQSPKAKQKSEDAMDSDADDEDDARPDEGDDDKEVVVDKGMLSPEDAAKQGELAEGVRKIKLKRQHSAEPLARGPPAGESSSGSPVSGTPAPSNSAAEGSSSTGATADAETSVASPFKKHRASLPGFDESVRKSLGQALLGQKERGNSEGTIPTTTIESKMEEDEEL